MFVHLGPAVERSVRSRDESVYESGPAAGHTRAQASSVIRPDLAAVVPHALRVRLHRVGWAVHDLRAGVLPCSRPGSSCPAELCSPRRSHLGRATSILSRTQHEQRFAPVAGVRKNEERLTHWSITAGRWPGQYISRPSQPTPAEAAGYQGSPLNGFMAQRLSVHRGQDGSAGSDCVCVGSVWRSSYTVGGCSASCRMDPSGGIVLAVLASFVGSCNGPSRSPT